MKEEKIIKKIRKKLSKKDIKRIDFVLKLNDLIGEAIKDLSLAEIIGHLGIAILRLYEIGLEVGKIVEKYLELEDEKPKYIG